MLCGLLGKSLKHSYSPQIHSYLGSYEYKLFEKTPEELADFFATADFSSINVTIPYKKDVIPYCTRLSDCARKMGAVNTIVKNADGELIGHNTDYFGFYSMVQRTGLDVRHQKVLVLGSGGASVTAVSALQELGAQVVTVSRTGENHYGNLHLHADAVAIVNCTPVGMYPNTGESPVNLNLFPRLEGVLDLVYNPSRTKLLMDAEARGIPTENGLWMLVAQAKEASEWFTGSKISDSAIEDIYNRLTRQMQNLILIGMPGCGKSTVGKLLADRLGKKFVDADTEIEKMAQMSIPEIFQLYGEEGFRQRETAVLHRLGQESSLVIATGGGCVTRSENYPLLHQNGQIVWLQRELSFLPTEGRPLSQNGKLEQMYQIRQPMYQQFADVVVSNDTSPEAVVESILKGWEL